MVPFVLLCGIALVAVASACYNVCGSADRVHLSAVIGCLCIHASACCLSYVCSGRGCRSPPHALEKAARVLCRLGKFFTCTA
eukprot:3084401-Amphidinium_carterae.1